MKKEKNTNKRKSLITDKKRIIDYLNEEINNVLYAGKTFCDINGKRIEIGVIVSEENNNE